MLDIKKVAGIIEDLYHFKWKPWPSLGLYGSGRLHDSREEEARFIFSLPLLLLIFKDL